jgi:hypothetical protein
MHSLSLSLSLSLSASHPPPRLLILSPVPLLNFYVSPSQLQSPKISFPTSQEIDTFRSFPYNFSPSSSLLHPLPRPSSVRQVYINHRGLTKHKKGSPSFVPPTCHEIGRQERRNITWDWKQSRYPTGMEYTVILPCRYT